MSLLASGWSRVYGAGIRRGTPGAPVAVQNLVIAGSSGLVQHAARFFSTLVPNFFHILEAAWKSRCKCEHGAVYTDGNFSRLLIQGLMFMFQCCSEYLCILQRLAHMPLKNSFFLWAFLHFLNIERVWNGSSSILSWTLLQSSSLHFP